MIGAKWNVKMATGTSYELTKLISRWRWLNTGAEATLRMVLRIWAVSARCCRRETSGGFALEGLPRDVQQVRGGRLLHGVSLGGFRSLSQELP